MVSFNKTIQVGNITRDPELRFTQNGVAVCDFGIAVNRVRSKQEDAPPDFFNVTAWRELGETIANYKKKGDPVFIEGRLEYSSWENEEGQKRSAVKIVAETVQFLPGKNGDSSGKKGVSAGGGTRQAAAHGRDQQAEVPEDEDFDDIPFATLNLKRPIF